MRRKKLTVHPPSTPPSKRPTHGTAPARLTRGTRAYPLTVASFRTWRGLRAPVAWDQTIGTATVAPALKRRASGGIRPRYSGLRVQGTATSPSSTANLCGTTGRPLEQCPRRSRQISVGDCTTRPGTRANPLAPPGTDGARRSSRRNGGGVRRGSWTTASSASSATRRAHAGGRPAARRRCGGTASHRRASRRGAQGDASPLACDIRPSAGPPAPACPPVFSRRARQPADVTGGIHVSEWRRALPPVTGALRGDGRLRSAGGQLGASVGSRRAASPSGPPPLPPRPLPPEARPPGPVVASRHP